MRVKRNITVKRIEALNKSARKLVADYYHGKVQIFDSFLPLQNRYNELCNKYKFPRELTKEWDCVDPLHTGFVINEYYSQMLLNFVCNS